MSERHDKARKAADLFDALKASTEALENARQAERASRRDQADAEYRRIRERLHLGAAAFDPPDEELRVMDRVAAFRHALKYAGYLPKSVDLAVERNRDWLQIGDWTGEPKQ